MVLASHVGAVAALLEEGAEQPDDEVHRGRLAGHPERHTVARAPLTRRTTACSSARTT